MAETDIFNPTNWQALGYPFNPNPSYGFERRMGANKQAQRPRLGLWVERDVMNGGHIFGLNWINTDVTVAERLIEFYHGFKAGYFTLIDQDWFGRQYVGRFMAQPNIVHTANAKYTCMGLLFEEMPQARMLTYPGLQFGHPLNVVDDYLNPLAALMQGTWTIQISPLAAATFTTAPTLSTPAALEAIDLIAAVGDWAQTAYVGFGFQVVFRLSNTLGSVNVSLDGAVLVTGLDLSSGTATATAAGTTLAVTAAAGGVPAFATLASTSVPLDMHYVTVIAAGPSTGSTAAGASTWSIVFPQVTYIY